MFSAEAVMVAAIFVVAALYSSVGHGGASGYLAVMALASVASQTMRPAAFILNIFVAGIAAIQFYRAGHFAWRIFWPFAAASIPFAYLGGSIELPTHIYKALLGGILVLAAIRLAWKFDPEQPLANFRPLPALLIGAALGLVSGMIGIGGGIFLTPLLLLMNWSDPKTAAGVSAFFILVNSAAGLLANSSQMALLPTNVWFWIAAAIGGGLIGSAFGSRRFSSIALRRMLAVVLLFAGIKLVFT